jgi:hypothetical protein
MGSNDEQQVIGEYQMVFSDIKSLLKEYLKTMDK